MYFDPRLWQFTKGVRLRIAGAVFVGLISAAVGIGRLALLGWLLAMVFQGAGFEEPLHQVIEMFGDEIVEIRLDANDPISLETRPTPQYRP